MFKRDKSYCLYLAYYPLRQQDVSAKWTHAALLLVPSSPSTKDEDSYRYHVTTRAGEAWWEYERVKTKAKTQKLASLVLVADGISKDMKEAIDSIMADQPIKQHDLEWNCYDWAISALTSLQRYGIIQLPGFSQEDFVDVWKRGQTFCEQVYKPSLAPKDPTPTCDIYGMKIAPAF